MERRREGRRTEEGEREREREKDITASSSYSAVVSS